MADRAHSLAQQLRQYSAWSVPNLAELCYYQNTAHGRLFIYNRAHTRNNLPTLQNKARHGQLEAQNSGSGSKPALRDIPLYDLNPEDQARLRRIRSTVGDDAARQREQLRRLRQLSAAVTDLNYMVRSCLLSVDSLTREIGRIEDKLAAMEVRAMYFGSFLDK